MEERIEELEKAIEELRKVVAEIVEILSACPACSPVAGVEKLKSMLKGGQHDQ